MFTPLTGRQNYKLAQSKETQDVLDKEDRIDANEFRQQKLEQNEKEYRASQRVAKGKLVTEWNEIGEGKRLRHEKTGGLLLNGAYVKEGQRLMVRFDNNSEEVIVRYNVNREHQIIGVYGDRGENKTPIKLVQGMKASLCEEPEEETPTGWHIHYGGLRWNVVKDNLCAGSFEETQDAADLCDLLNAHEHAKAQDAERDKNNVHFRRV